MPLGGMTGACVSQGSPGSSCLLLVSACTWANRASTSSCAACYKLDEGNLLLCLLLISWPFSDPCDAGPSMAC